MDAPDRQSSDADMWSTILGEPASPDELELAREEVLAIATQDRMHLATNATRACS